MAVLLYLEVVEIGNLVLAVALILVLIFREIDYLCMS